MVFKVDTTQSAHALDQNQEALADRGYYVVQGCEASLGNTDFAVDVTAGSVAVDSTIVDVDEQTVGLDVPNTNPYQAALYVDANGDVQVEKGSEAAIEPSGATEIKQVELPAPPAFASTNETVIATVLVKSGGVDGVLKRRWLGDRSIDDLEANTAAIDALRQNLDVDDNDLENIATAFADLVETKTSKPTERQYLPQYGNVANAPQQAPSLIEVPPNSATTPPGLYAYDPEAGEYVFVQGEVTVQNSGDLSDLNIDGDKGWGGYDLTNLGAVRGQTGDFDSVEADQGNIATQSDEIHYVSEFDGATPGDRFDAALSKADNGNTLVLDNDQSYPGRTVSKAIVLTSNGYGFGNAPTLNDTWVFEEVSLIERIRHGAGLDLTVQGSETTIQNCQFFGSTPIQIEADDCLYINNGRGDVTFASGTTGGIVDSCASETSVVDNGSNTVGDLG